MLRDYLIFGTAVLCLDIPFIKYIVLPKYIKLFDSLGIRMNSKLGYGLFAYLAMISSFYLIKSDNPKQMLINAALVGFAIYGTYAFTLLTILPGYTLDYGLLETFWGVILYLTATLITINITF